MNIVKYLGVFALGAGVGLLAPQWVNLAQADAHQGQSETYNLEWEKLALDPEFRKAITIVVNEACIVQNSFIYCD